MALKELIQAGIMKIIYDNMILLVRKEIKSFNDK